MTAAETAMANEHGSGAPEDCGEEIGAPVKKKYSDYYAPSICDDVTHLLQAQSLLGGLSLATEQCEMFAGGHVHCGGLLVLCLCRSLFLLGIAATTWYGQHCRQVVSSQLDAGRRTTEHGGEGYGGKARAARGRMFTAVGQ